MDALKLFKLRRKIQHDGLDDEIKLVLSAATEKMIDAGINVEDKNRQASIMNLQLDIAQFFFQDKTVAKSRTVAKEIKLPRHVIYAINNLYFAQMGDKK